MNSAEEIDVASELYSGGNEVFFSFLQALVGGADEGLFAPELTQQVLRNWGYSWGKRAELPNQVNSALDGISQALAALGLVRVFTPGRAQDEAQKILVLRCLLGRYVGVPRIHKGLSHRCLLAPIVEGAMKAAGLECAITTDKQGMLRSDECVLTGTLETKR